MLHDPSELPEGGYYSSRMATIVAMESSRPLRVVTAALDGDLLTVLAGGDAAFTGRQLARLVDASSEGVRKVLARLVAQGIVTQDVAGAAHLYRLNRDHLAAPAVIALAGLRAGLIDRLRTAIAEWRQQPAYAALFGSVARGEDRADSDLDICVVRPDGLGPDDTVWRRQVAELETAATRWTGNDTRVLELSSADVVADASVADDVLRDGIALAGDPAALRRHKAADGRTRRVASGE
jgi:hypothetical protein